MVGQHWRWYSQLPRQLGKSSHSGHRPEWGLLAAAMPEVFPQQAAQPRWRHGRFLEHLHRQALCQGRKAALQARPLPLAEELFPQGRPGPGLPALSHLTSHHKFPTQEKRTEWVKLPSVPGLQFHHEISQWKLFFLLLVCFLKQDVISFKLSYRWGLSCPGLLGTGITGTLNQT